MNNDKFENAIGFLYSLLVNEGRHLDDFTQKLRDQKSKRIVSLQRDLYDISENQKYKDLRPLSTLEGIKYLLEHY